MKRVLKLGAITLVGLFILTGCRTSAVYNVNNDPIEVKVSGDSIYNAIKQAGYSKGWIISKIRPGLAQGKLLLRDHVAIVEIPYTNKEFSIIYKDSTNLNYDSQSGKIHSNYNGWIQNLENAINFELSALNQ